MASQESKDATELRKDPILDRWVLFAEGRARRPNEFAGTSTRDEVPQSFLPAASCPFCPGEESRTPPSVYEAGDAQGAWQLRVVPNKYPAVISLDGDAAGTSENLPEADDSLVSQGSRPAWGAHEVVIETRRHVQWMGELVIEELCRILAAYRQRLQHWREDRRLTYGLVFKNAGASSGASLAHLHSQLIALADVPPDVAREVQRAEDFFNRHGTCPICAMVKAEREFGGRVVLDSGNLISFCPYASLQPFETWIVPADHRPAFEASDDDDLHALAELLLEVFRRIERIAVPTGYNVLVRTAPWCRGVAAWCHWRIEILPRTTALAGFELATGMAINHLFPERAAESLRRGSTEKE